MYILLSTYNILAVRTHSTTEFWVS